MEGKRSCAGARRVLPSRKCQRRAPPQSLLDDIPRAILGGSILPYLDPASLVQAAASCTTLRRVIYDENWHETTNTTQRSSTGAVNSLWNSIDFGSVPTAMAAQLTDRQLATLLQHCRAVDRCRVLQLTGCTAVRGVGLGPLVGSRVLREIDLWLDRSVRYGPEELNFDIVFPILSSMHPLTPFARDTIVPPNAPCGLAFVKIRRQTESDSYFQSYSNRIGNWYRAFSEALRTDFRDRRVPCIYCQKPFDDIHSWDDLFWAVPYSYCQQCGNHSCQQYSCVTPYQCDGCHLQCCQYVRSKEEMKICPRPIMIYFCAACAYRFCDECDEMVLCENMSECGHLYCESCRNVCEPCEKCGEDFCPDCLEDHQRSCGCECDDGGDKDGDAA